MNDEIKEKLVRMTDKAAKRMAARVYWFEVKGKRRYVRINSSGFRAVSLDSENPCGRLVRGDKKVGSKILESALKDAKDDSCNNPRLGNGKPEHKVQASIIWDALTNPKGLPETLKITSYADSLWFVTDELSLGVIRADVIMLGELNGRFFPVFIELKYGRSTEVGTQVKEAFKLASKHTPEFCSFLAAATGKLADKIEMKNAVLLVIWGSIAGKERPEAQQMRKENILTVCHSEEKPGQYKFHLVTE